MPQSDWQAPRSGEGPLAGSGHASTGSEQFALGLADRLRGRCPGQSRTAQPRIVPSDPRRVGAGAGAWRGGLPGVPVPKLAKARGGSPSGDRRWPPWAPRSAPRQRRVLVTYRRVSHWIMGTLWSSADPLRTGSTRQLNGLLQSMRVRRIDCRAMLMAPTARLTVEQRQLAWRLSTKGLSLRAVGRLAVRMRSCVGVVLHEPRRPMGRMRGGPTLARLSLVADEINRPGPSVVDRSPPSRPTRNVAANRGYRSLPIRASCPDPNRSPPAHPGSRPIPHPAGAPTNHRRNRRTKETQPAARQAARQT